jgi:HK97 family phage major capsid protein
MKNYQLLSAMSAAAVLAAAPRSLSGPVMADGGPAAEAIAEMKAAIEGHQTKISKGWAELQATWKQFHEELNAKTKDVVSETKINAMNEAVAKQIEELKAQTGAVGKLDKKMVDVEAELDKLNRDLKAMSVTGGASGKVDPRAANPAFQDYCKTFNTWFRKGGEALEATLRDLEVKAAVSMTSSSNPDGGYTVIPEMDQAIDEVLKEVSMMRSLATVRAIGTGEYKKLVNQHGTTSGWVGESETRAETNGPTLAEVKFPVMEIYAQPAASQTLLDDSFVNLAQWLADEVNLEFAYQEGSAFIAGTGQNMPRGIVGGYTPVANASYAWGAPGFIATGSSGAFVADPNGDKVLIDTYFALKSAYRKNATWLMNRGTQGTVRKLKNSDGDPLLTMSILRDGMVELLLGRPVEEMPDMPDIGANSYSIALGDWKRAYLIVDRIGTRVLRDPFTRKPYVLFYTTKRVGGGVQNFEAYKLLKFAN